MELSRAAVCRDCWALFFQPRRTSLQALGALRTKRSNVGCSKDLHTSPHGRILQTHRLRPSSRQQAPIVAAPSTRLQHQSSADFRAIHDRVLDLTASAVNLEDAKLPSEQRVIYVLEQFHAISDSFSSPQGPTQSHTTSTRGAKRDGTATSALLGSVNSRSYPAFMSKASCLALLSEKAEEILRHPNIFITPAILKAYVEVQTHLQQPNSLADAFHLYAHKEVPQVNNEGRVSLSPAQPDKISAAIDSTTANLALTSALNAHDLPLAIDVISTSFCTPAFKKSKVLRHAIIPGAGIGIAPFAAYALSTQFSEWQSAMDPGTATYVAFSGIMTYVAAVSTIGYVAITTANDQMDRITWAQGVPLWERWVREEERAAIDRVAGTWGFHNVEKRGDEEGQEWEQLREFVGLRGMILDRVELMEGME